MRWVNEGARDTKTFERQLQSCLNKIEKWCIENRFKVPKTYNRKNFLNLNMKASFLRDNHTCTLTKVVSLFAFA